jgi:DNA-binding NarL/FixJ family response regulator
LIGLAGEPSFLNLDVYDTDANESKIAKENPFSKKELEIIRLLAEGKESKNIAEILFITEETVKTHRKNILRKSGCNNSMELVARGMSEGWI